MRALGDTVTICPTCHHDQVVNFLRAVGRSQWPRCCGIPMQVLFSDADVIGALTSLAFRLFIDTMAGEPPSLPDRPWRIEWWTGDPEDS